jgi:DNA end-binding protein Ku
VPVDATPDPKESLLMPRPIWSGSLSFGLVNVPVSLHSAVRDKSIRFSLLHEPDHSPIQTRRVCSEESEEVPFSEIVKGYELEDGSWVLLTDEELEAAAPRKSKTIDIERFVEEAEVDPVYYERSYLLTPREESATRAYRLLSETMGDARKVALGRVVLRARERLVVIRSQGDSLALSTMRFHDEVRSADEIVAEMQASKPSRKEVERAVAVIEELSVPFEPQQYHDEHRAHLQRVIESKQKGKRIVAEPEPPVEQPPTVAPDLMGALEESLAKIRGEGASSKKSASRSAKKGSGAQMQKSSGSGARKPAASRRS